MKRNTFLKLAGLSTLAMAMKPLTDLEKIASVLPNTPKMPVLFLGHGSPMNAIEENEFTLAFKNIAKTLPIKPNAIICVSAHWLTKGTKITAMEHPKTIHDFGGFPQALFDVQYPAKGDINLAEQTKKLLLPNAIELDYDWGLDHGAWSVLKHLYPEADIPVIQLSIDYYKDAEYHFNLSKRLSKLRDKGVLIIGSGNIVHNLRRLGDKTGYEWGNKAKEIINKYLIDGNFKPLLDYKKLGSEVQLAIPTPDHYYPLIYSLGLQDKGEEIKLFNDKLDGPSISMTSVKIG